MRKGLVGALVASAALVAVPALAQEYHYVKVAEIYVPSVVGHGDWVSYDPSNKMVYVSMKDDGMAVIDTRTNTVAHVFKDIPDPNVMTFDANYIYETVAEGLPQGMNGSNNSTGFSTRNEIVVIDKHTWQIVDRVELWPHGTTPDAIVNANGRIFVAMDDNNVENVYTAGAHPQFVAQFNIYPYNTNHWWLNTSDYTGPDASGVSPDGRELFQSSNSSMDVYDTSTFQLLRHREFPLHLTSKGGTKAPIYDPSSGLLWVSTTNEKPGVLVLNPNTLELLHSIPESGSVDGMSFDPGLGLMYTFAGYCKADPAAKGKGCFDVYSTKTFTHVAMVPSYVGQTHTGAVDTDTHAVYAYEGFRAAVGVYCPVAGPGKNGDWAVPVGSAAGSPCGSGYVAMAGASNYTVYFEFNKSNLTGDAQHIVNEAAAAAKHGTARIVVDGYTDLAGTAQYNQGLSVRRANAVKAALIADGIPASRISVHGFGKTNPAVPTPDGVREPRNRRAVVVIGPGSTS